MAAEFYESGAKNRFKPLEIQVEGSEPFLHDKLDRKCEIENLSQLLINSEAPLVLAVDAEWGSGKTTFLKMWKAFLAKEHPSYASIFLAHGKLTSQMIHSMSFLGRLISNLHLEHQE